MSFVSDSVQKWNSLNVEARETSSINIFGKTSFKKVSKPRPFLHYVNVTINIT